MVLLRSLALVTVAGVLSASAAAKDGPKNEPPRVFQAVTECLAIADPQARLACYDESVRALEAARADRELMIADREQVRDAKRGLFGLSLPDFRLFSNDSEEITEINSKVASYRYDSSGRAIITLTEGGSWQQIDSKSVRLLVGKDVRIRRAALGSYMANIGSAAAIRVLRLN